MKIEINAYAPFRSGRYETFVSAERGCKHIGLNGARERVRQYQIDGGVLPKGQQPERCDYLLINDDLDKCVRELHMLIDASHHAPKCSEGLLERINEQLKIYA